MCATSLHVLFPDLIEKQPVVDDAELADPTSRGRTLREYVASDGKISSPLSPNCGVPLELPVAVRSKPIAQLARYIARVSPARGRGLAHEIKYLFIFPAIFVTLFLTMPVLLTLVLVVYVWLLKFVITRV